jgi:hypothetical protein
MLYANDWSIYFSCITVLRCASLASNKAVGQPPKATVPNMYNRLYPLVSLWPCGRIPILWHYSGVARDLGKSRQNNVILKAVMFCLKILNISITKGTNSSGKKGTARAVQS